MSKEKQTYKVFSLKLAQLLCNQGFHVLETLPNKQKPWLNVYVFENTAQLRGAIQDYITNHKG